MVGGSLHTRALGPRPPNLECREPARAGRLDAVRAYDPPDTPRSLRTALRTALRTVRETGEFQQVACLTDWRAACRLPGHKRRRSRREGSAPRRFGHSSRSSSATCIGFAPSRLSSSTRHEACCQTAPSALRLPLSTAPSGGFARRAGRARRCSYRLCTTSRSWQTRTSFPTSSSWSTWTITRLCRALRRRRCARRLRSSPFTRRLGTRTCSARAAPSARHRSSAWPPCTSAALGRRRGRRAGRSASGRATRTAVSTSLAAAPATCSPTSRPRARLRCSTWG